MLSKLVRLYNTVKFLKAKQIYYRLYYYGRAKIRKILGIEYPLFKTSESVSFDLQESIHIVDCYLQEGEFRFLNLSKSFDNIDWNYSEYGKLWTYNLNYFDFLSQDSDVDKLKLINSFIDSSREIEAGLEAFPISLRGINWIKYLSFNNISDKKIDDSLYAQYYILLDSLEYHLLGNHLLENSFSLLFGAYYFEDETLYKKAKELLLEQLEEQILDDGGHFELSPMYHQIMLFRLLDCVNLVKNSSWMDRELFGFLQAKAELMLGWIESISYKNGDIPLLNDSAYGIAPTTEQLIAYGKRLGLRRANIKLLDSGYRKIVKDNYELVVDVGDIGAEYIPGHAHADTLSFELRVGGKPFIVDTGLSNYETSLRRTIERSTLSHNTVEVDSRNQSEIWGGFRVGNRARVVELEESEEFIEATHNGYKPILHTRRWSFDNSSIVIEDSLNINSSAIARLHFHPDVSKDDILKYIEIDSSNWRFEEYLYSPEFNKQIDAVVVVIPFDSSLKIKIDTKS